MTEVTLGCLIALLNTFASQCIQRIMLKKRDIQFLKIFLVGNFIKYVVLLGLTVTILSAPSIDKLGFIGSFAGAYFITFIYYILNSKRIFFTKQLFREINFDGL